MASETKGATRCATLLGLGVWREVDHCEEDCPDPDTEYSSGGRGDGLDRRGGGRDLVEERLYEN